MKVLIVKTSSLGDLVQTFPIVGYLRDRFPGAQIDWVVEKPYAELIAAHPEVTRTLAVKTKAWRHHFLKPSTWREISSLRKELRETTYDVAFDLQGNIKSGLILSQVSAKDKVGFAKPFLPEWPNLLFTNKKYSPPCRSNIRHDYLSIVKQYFGDREEYLDKGVLLQTTASERAQIEKLTRQAPQQVLVATGSAWRNKELPLDTLKQLLEGIQGHLPCSFLFSYGSDAELQRATALVEHFKPHSLLVPKLSLPALQLLMHQVKLIIAMDSLPLHLAGTTSTPTFGFFGPSLASKYQPLNSGAFQGSCPYGRSFKKRCPILRTCPTGACLREKSSDELLGSFLDWYRPTVL